MPNELLNILCITDTVKPLATAIQGTFDH